MRLKIIALPQPYSNYESSVKSASGIREETMEKIYNKTGRKIRVYASLENSHTSDQSTIYAYEISTKVEVR